MKFIADMHTHTLASTHAYSTITENAKWSEEHGIKYLGMTDHGIAMQDSPDTWHFENLGILPDYIGNTRIFRGMEANILDFEGNLDIIHDMYYRVLEWVNVSFHVQVVQPSTKAEHTKAYLNVLKNPYVDVLCHTEGEKYDYDFDEVCRACSYAGKLIEVNECRLNKHPESYERYRMILEACEKHNTGIIVNSDAHFYTKIGDFRTAEKILTETGFPEKLIINADEQRFINYINSRNR